MKAQGKTKTTQSGKRYDVHEIAEQMRETDYNTLRVPVRFANMVRLIGGTNRCKQNPGGSGSSS